MIWLSLLLSLIAAGGPNREEAGITTVGEQWTATEDWSEYVQLQPLKVVYDGETYDEMTFSVFLPANTAYVVRCDPAGMSIADTLAPDYPLVEEVWPAIDACPEWLRFDLINNLIELTPGVQGIIADMILNPIDPRFRDEIAFQAAYLAPSRLGSMDLGILARNLDSLYAIDNELQYVEIVDYGDPETDEDYYSTTRYKNSDGSTIEIPREIYYWYVIMPRITDELPKIIYEKFWREYLYYNNGTVSYTENPEGDPYPLLRDVLKDISFVWDGVRQVWPADREHSTDMGAIDAIGWWVSRILPRSATSPRPVQPNQLATDHDGNCGECQDLFCAGLRTGMIPALGVMDINEDHVWNAFWWPDDAFSTGPGWYPCQVDLGGGVTHAADSGCAYDNSRGGGKYCSMIWNWRTDGYQWSAIETYSDCCTLTVAVYNTEGNPVPEAEVKLRSEGWKTLVKIAGFGGITDRDGLFTTTLGEGQNYYVMVGWDELGRVIDSASALTGEHFFTACTVSFGAKPRILDTEPKTPDPLGDVALYLEVNAEYDLARCPTYVYSEEVKSKAAVKFAPGKLTDFIVTDYEGLVDFLAEEKFATYKRISFEGEKGLTIALPANQARYLVFFNNHPGMGEVVSGTISMVEPEDVAESRPIHEPLKLETSPGPKDRSCVFKVSGCSETLALAIFDKLGRRVYETTTTPEPRGAASIEWDRQSQPSGVYFVLLKSGNQELTRKFVVLK
ncbi:T9SS type A sorting domain-containing protein [candidate division WOR-3 bacterium]|nr:T9SS type A sorting domain-containing protein [candidate division WOR-3 bacterium]